MHTEDHASRHTSGADDIQSATTGQKGLMTSAQATDLTNAVLKTLFNANSILKADADNTPEVLAVAASRLIGRKATGDIGALTAAEVRTILNVSESSVFGSEFAQNASITSSSTTLTTYQNKLRLAMTSVPSGNYLIFWGCEYYNSAGNNGNIRVQLDDVGTIAESHEYDDVWYDYRASMGLWYGALNGDHDVDLDYRSISGGGTEYIRQARIICFRVS